MPELPDDCDCSDWCSSLIDWGGSNITPRNQRAWAILLSWTPRSHIDRVNASVLCPSGVGKKPLIMGKISGPWSANKLLLFSKVCSSWHQCLAQIVQHSSIVGRVADSQLQGPQFDQPYLGFLSTWAFSGTLQTPKSMLGGGWCTLNSLWMCVCMVIWNELVVTWGRF